MATKMRVKETRWVRAGDLLAHPRNWRRHPEYQRKALEGVLDEVGFASVLVAYEDDDGLRLIDGHLRAETEPDLIVPVAILDVTAEEAEKILATFDPLAAMARPDQDVLLGLLNDVTFGDKAVTDMLEALANGETTPLPVPIGSLFNDEEDEANTDAALTEAEAETYVPFSKRGQVWALGSHRLMCGDATNAADVALATNGGSPTVILTDPPYGLNYDGGANNSKKRERLAGDESTALYGAALALSPASVAYLWHDPTKAQGVYQAVEECGYEVRAQIIWVKINPHFGAFMAHYMQAHEALLYCVKGASHWVGPTNERTVWEVPQPHRNEHHPTQKPIECMERPLRNHEGDVYDPFVGSGTTIIAAEKLGRRCYAMEIEPRYVDVAIKRWEAYTGQKAELVV